MYEKEGQIISKCCIIVPGKINSCPVNWNPQWEKQVNQDWEYRVMDGPAGMRVMWKRCWKGQEWSGRCVVEGRIAWGRVTRRRRMRGNGSAERRATSCRRWPCDGLRELLGTVKCEVWCASARIGASGAWWMIGAGGGAALTQSRAIYLPLNSTCNEECFVGVYTLT